MMTDAEYEEAIREINEYVKRTSFPAVTPEDETQGAWTHTRHAEYGEAAQQ